MAQLLSRSNLLSYDLIVSTNYFSRGGYNPAVRANPTNVNYDFRVGGAPLSTGERLQNAANLFYDPRPPVYIGTNGPNSAPEFRFYLDLNRNGRFDSNGVLPVINKAGKFFDTNNTEYSTVPFPAVPNLVSNYFVGDPEWIGQLEYPDKPHSATNKFVARYAYLVVPEGKCLDLNFMGNSAKRLGSGIESFFRNQGVGPWELNLAAFLRDLNTNAWAENGFGYEYITALNTASRGLAFEDSLTLLRHRYNGTYANLASVQNLFGLVGAEFFRTNLFDDYADGPFVMGSLSLTNDNEVPDITKLPWPGADNPRTFFHPQGLFSLASSSASFSNLTARLNLQSLRDTNASYDRYTFYRLLGQLGMDSAPALTHKLYFAYPEITNSVEIVTNKINLNWKKLADPQNLDDNFEAWEPTNFFHVTADRLLRGSFLTVTNTNFFSRALFPSYHLIGDTPVRTNISITNIQVWHVTNTPVGYLYTNSEYTASVHRLLQLAANISDASVAHSNPRMQTPAPPFYPSVFRPRFAVTSTNVVITGYVDVKETETDIQLKRPWWDLENPAERAQLASRPDDNVWGVPWIIGAKKGYPNFNEFSLQSYVQVTRKLQVTKPSALDKNPRSWVTNQMYLLSISNVFGVEAWNSYTNQLGYPRPLEMQIEARFTLLLTNTNRVLLFTNFIAGVTNQYTLGEWKGSPNPNYPLSYRVPLLTNKLTLPDSAYYFNSPQSTFVAIPNNFGFERNIGFPVPEWGLVVSNSLRYVLLDRVSRQVVDFVNLTRLTNGVNITHELIGRTQVDEASAPGSMWLTNRPANSFNVRVPTFGHINQALGSLGEPVLGGQPLSDADWTSYNGSRLVDDKRKAIDKFRRFLGLSPITYNTADNIRQLDNELGQNASHQAPYAPTRKLYLYSSWQANDPLVHYTVEDLTDPLRTNVVNLIVPPNLVLVTNENLGRLNDRYEPWGGHPLKVASRTAFQIAVKDPLVFKSDDWDFPTNKFPNLGALGRVHRGTPWQTVYLKSLVMDTNAWAKWSGSLGTHPTNDWKLLDYFTAASSENAARGLLSVNQTNLAAWSALLSGVSVLSNNVADAVLTTNDRPSYARLFIEPVGWTNPAAISPLPPLLRIVDGINRTRAGLTNSDRVFPYLGMVLATPELTVASPYLNTSTADQIMRGIGEAAYERIPQQVLSLLKSDEPRFTVYAFGQSLKPADRSIVLSGDFRGMATNYQVVGEVATKTVVRIEGELNKEPRAVIESYKILPSE